MNPRILLLGGTAWLGRAIATAAVTAGADVTCLARGESGSVAAGARLVRADRREPDAYDALDGDWDDVVELSWDPAFVASGLDALADRAAHWTLVSSVSVYAHSDAPFAAEDAELDAAVAEMGYKPEQVADLIDWIYNKENGLIKRALNYQLLKDDFLRLFKIKDYDVRLAEAEDKGYKRGKNEKIDMYRHSQRQRDNMPADLTSGGGEAPKAPETEENSTLKALRKMKKY